MRPAYYCTGMIRFTASRFLLTAFRLSCIAYCFLILNHTKQNIVNAIDRFSAECIMCAYQVRCGSGTPRRLEA
jgi:hypothetical protein